MKYLLVLILLLSLCGCNVEVTSTIDKEDEKVSLEKENKEMMVYGYVNDERLEIILEDNETTVAFNDLFSDKDLVLTLNEYGNFEKVGSLGETLPRNDTHIKTNPGDIVLYNGDNISIFYNSNSWSYTYLGKIVNKTQEELIELFGSGDIEIRFSNK